MKVLYVLAALAVICHAMPSGDLFDHELDEFWASYKQIHKKSYEGSEEYVRRVTWESNLQYIRRHNLEADLGMHRHRLGMNEHGDLTDDEYNTLLKGFFVPNVTSDAPLFMEPENTDSASMVDWREHGYVTPVKNQGHCGSCWAFSATGALEGQHYRKSGTLVSLSEQNLVDCAKKLGAHGCKGGSMDIAFEYIKMNHGIDTEESYPYKAKDGMCHFNPQNIGATDMGFVNIPHGDEKALMKAVSSVGPISVAIDAGTKNFRFYKEGVFTDMTCSSKRLDHGVLAVGYGEERGEEYWLVKNSWGESWGMEGYIKMRRNHGNMCGIATMASYPEV